ncbi:MAG: thioredoxin family protein [Candidatus Cloacimonetes bacterium]|nr:thioredoxin family protein [Candidatus Cloacimonadota bacterium]
MKKIMLLFCFVLMISLSAEITVLDSTDSTATIKPQITFHEFGSTTCVPCKMMEKVMDEVRTIYGNRVEVIFHNVNIERELSASYNIKMIPTQVFLDAEGKEFNRHVGYYPTSEIVKLFEAQGIK